MLKIIRLQAGRLGESAGRISVRNYIGKDELL